MSRSVRLFVVMLVASMAMMIGVSAAQANVPTQFTPQWGTVDGTSVWCELACFQPAWQWNGSWKTTQRHNGTQVYLYPYATGWAWTWTRDSGWLAMRSSDVSLPRPVYRYPSCPIGAYC